MSCRSSAGCPPAGRMRTSATCSLSRPRATAPSIWCPTASTAATASCRHTSNFCALMRQVNAVCTNMPQRKGSPPILCVLPEPSCSLLSGCTLPNDSGTYGSDVDSGAACQLCLLVLLQVIPTVGVDGENADRNRRAMLKHFSRLVDSSARKAQILVGLPEEAPQRHAGRSAMRQRQRHDDLSHR